MVLEKSALPGTVDGIDAVDLPLYFYFGGYGICDPYFAELQIGISGLSDVAAFVRGTMRGAFSSAH